MMRYALSITAAILAFAAAGPAEEKFTIPNDLGLPWPGDLVHFDVAGDVPAAPAVKAGDKLWPAQVQRVQEGGKAVNRVWFLAEIAVGHLAQYGQVAGVGVDPEERFAYALTGMGHPACLLKFHITAREATSSQPASRPAGTAP